MSDSETDFPLVINSASGAPTGVEEEERRILESIRTPAIPHPSSAAFPPDMTIGEIIDIYRNEPVKIRDFSTGRTFVVE